MTDSLAGLQKTDLPRLVHRGKVRDLYDLGAHLMIVATDRISAFDVVMDQPVPGKGVLLTQMSRFWLEKLPACSPHHLEYVVSDEHVPAGYEPHVAQLRGRAMVVKRVHILPIECVVRGYLVGGGWKEYQATGCVSGVKLPAGLRCAAKLPEPIFTPSTKAATGHDEPISFEQGVEAAGDWLRFVGGSGDRHRFADETEPVPAARQLLEQVRRRSLDIYTQAARYAETRGIIIADTKFEFGLIRTATVRERLSLDSDLLLADEVLTPDSSRFWPKESYRVGENPPSFDKQYLRDYLETLTWNKQPPPPRLPDEVIEKTRQKYAEAHRLLAG
jgi:phosphoribosylaminoimidazole-succinocarboxamide synthase